MSAAKDFFKVVGEYPALAEMVLGDRHGDAEEFLEYVQEEDLKEIDLDRAFELTESAKDLGMDEEGENIQTYRWTDGSSIKLFWGTDQSPDEVRVEEK